MHPCSIGESRQQANGHRQQSRRRVSAKECIFCLCFLLYITQNIYHVAQAMHRAVIRTDDGMLQRHSMPSGQHLQVGESVWRGGVVSSPAGRGRLPGGPLKWRGGCALQHISQPPCEVPAAHVQTHPCAIACAAWPQPHQGPVHATPSA